MKSYEVWRDRININKHADSLLSLVNVMSLVVLGIFIVIALILTWAQISMIIHQTPIKEPLIVYIFKIVGYDVVSLPPTQYSAILSTTSSTVALVVAICFAVFSAINLVKHRKDVKKQAIIQTKRVYVDGVDDLKIMLDYYKLAEKVVVYAGDFDWLTKNKDLKNEISRLAKEEKIDLFSHRDENTIKNSIDDDEIFNLLIPRFHFDYDKRIKCSIVETKGNQVFLYKSEQKIVGRENNVCIIQGINEGQYLLQIIINLLGPEPTTQAFRC